DVEADVAELPAALVDVGPANLAAVRGGAAVADVDVEVEVVVEVGELAVAARVVRHALEALGRLVGERAGRAALGAAVVDVDAVGLRAEVAAVGDQHVEVAVQVDIAHVDVLGGAAVELGRRRREV